MRAGRCTFSAGLRIRCITPERGGGRGVTELIDLNELKNSGVEILGDGVYIEDDCVVEAGAKIVAPAHILAGTHVCRGATVMPFCLLSHTYVGEDTVVYSSTLIDAHVGRNCSVGPYAYLRGGAIVGDDCRIGDFVEIKGSTLGKGTKAAHLAYIGDADLGERVNVGCGAVFANYDGREKRRTVVGDGCFIGCNSNLVAPLTLRAGAYVAAGTTVTRDLEEYDFCIGRSREKVIAGGAVGRYAGQ